MKNYDIQRIIARYLETPVSISKIAEEFDLCKITVSRLLKKANIPMWTRQDLNIGELKTDYFQKIDTEDKAYLLGLFDGDGSIVIRKAHPYGKALRCCVVILAHSKLINQLRDYLEIKLNLSHLNFCCDGGEAYSVRYASRHDFIAVTDFIYKNAKLYFKRKHNKYLEALSYLS